MTAQIVPNEIENGRLGKPIGRGVKVAPVQSGGVAYASGEQLASLGEFVRALTTATERAGWRADALIVSLDGEEESIVVGVKWVTNAYYVEIR